MDKNRALDVAEGRSAAEERLKGQQIAQLEQENALRTGVANGDEKAIASWNRLHPQTDVWDAAPGGDVRSPSGVVMKAPPVFYRKHAGPTQGGAQSNKPPSQADLEYTAKEHGITVEEVKARLAKLQAGGK